MWIFAILLAILLHSSSSQLSGLNVCPQEEKYKVNVTHYVTRNVTVRSYVWCYRFPPRCTTFSVKQVSDTEIREEDRVRHINHCCEGYEPDKEGVNCLATSRCAVNCSNGICDAESKCYCNPGYRGDDCSKDCIPGRWGRYCRYHCNCVRGTCDPKTGQCSCFTGWTGSSCNEVCSKGFFGENCNITCNCQTGECNPIDGQCIYISSTSQNQKSKNITNVDNGIRRIIEEPTKELSRNDRNRTAVLQKYHTFDIKVLNNLETATNNNQNKDISTSTEANINTDKSTISTKDYPSSTQSNKELPAIYWKAHDNFLLTLETVSKNSKVSVDNVTEGTPKLLRMKVLKSYEEEDGEILTSLDEIRPREEAYLDDGEIHKKLSTRTGSLFLVIGAIAGISLMLIGVLSLVLAIRRFKKIAPTEIEDKKTKQEKEPKSNTLMSVTTRSIFHTPLPEPPIINNPVFTTPMENSSIFETHVVCNISQICRENIESAEMFYDHPPSTGSYRAVTHPEPPETELLHLQQHRENCGEPVYDEIPCWKAPESDSLYQNDTVTTSIYINSICESKCG